MRKKREKSLPSLEYSNQQGRQDRTSPFGFLAHFLGEASLLLFFFFKVEKMRYCTLSISTIIAHWMKYFFIFLPSFESPAFVKPIVFVPLSKRRQTWQDQDRVIDRLRETEIAKTRHQASEIN